VAFIQKESKKRDPDRAVLQDSMKRTAAYRQKMCHESSVQEVLTAFPPLKAKLFVSLTFCKVLAVNI